MTAIPDFKVTPFFDTEYIRNGTRYRHNFNEILIGTYTCHTQQCYCEWSGVTLSDLVKYSMTRSVARSLCDSWASCLSYPEIAVSCMTKVHVFLDRRGIQRKRSLVCCIFVRQNIMWYQMVRVKIATLLTQVRVAHYVALCTEGIGVWCFLHTVRQGRRWVCGSWVNGSHGSPLFDGSHGSCVSGCWPMTHHFFINIWNVCVAVPYSRINCVCNDKW